MQRAQRKAFKVSTNTITPTLQPIKVIVRENEVREVAHDIVLYIQNKVFNFPSDESKRWAMSKVFLIPSISNPFPKTTNIQAFKSIRVQNEFIVGLVKSLEEVK
jgi:hypothetical protein